MSNTSRKRKICTERRPRKRRFIAAVRFADGRIQCFSVDNADNHDEARRMVFDEIADVMAVVISDYP